VKGQSLDILVAGGGDVIPIVMTQRRCSGADLTAIYQWHEDMCGAARQFSGRTG
jgi:hypothetical protein